MDNLDNNLEKKFVNSHLPVWLTIIILLIIAILVLVILFYSQQQTILEIDSNTAFEQVNNPTPPTTTKKETHLYIGEILKIDPSSITFKALALNNSLPKDIEMTARFDQNTQFSFLIMPSKITGDDKRDQILTSPTNASNLKIGQTASIYSLENISDSTKFLASQIQIHVLR